MHPDVKFVLSECCKGVLCGLIALGVLALAVAIFVILTT